MSYYEILGLACEGADVDNIALLRYTLENWKATKEKLLGNIKIQLKKDALKAELDEYENMEKLLTDAALRKKHAEELKKKRLEQLEPIIDVMSRYTTVKEITKARVATIARQLGLSNATTETKFKEMGYTVKLAQPIDVDEILLKDSEIRSIDESIKKIRDFIQAHPNNPMHELADLNNVYEYIAVMEGMKLADAENYRREHTTDELAGILEILKMKHTSNDTLLKFFQSLDSFAKNNIFYDDNTRRKYDNTLGKELLESLFATLLKVPNTIKLERVFAERCINEIQKIFTNEDEAIALYNKYSGLPNDTPYQKESSQVSTICANCSIVNYHDTIDIAKKSSCSNCGKPLYQICPKCKNKSPVIADYCSCGFFIKGMSNFDLYYNRFNTAISNYSIERAQEAYANAKSANPSEARLAEMDTKLKKLEGEIGESMKAIDTLISAGMVYTARQAAINLQAKRPKIDLKPKLSIIEQKINWATAEYEKCKRATSESSQVEICVAILSQVKDYEPALEWLRVHKPKPVQDVKGTVDSNEVSCTLQWKDDPSNRYVTYMIVRKVKAQPANEKDGVEIAKGLKVMAFKDTTLVPGEVYAYAVFAIRGDAASKPAHFETAVCIFKPITGIQANINNKVCTLSWEDIPGSKGVCIERSEDGGRRYLRLSDCARATFSDTSVRNGTTYRYAIKTVWEVYGKIYHSQAYTRDVQVEEKPPCVNIMLKHAGKDGNCEVTWSPDKRGTLKLIELREGVTPVKDQIYASEQLSELGKQVAAVPVSDGQYAWRAQSGKRFRVAAFRVFGDRCVSGLPVDISTVPPLEVNKQKTQIYNNRLQLVIDNVPSDVDKIYYLVSAKGETVNEGLAKQDSVPAIDASAYRQQGAIIVDKMPPSELTISVIALYNTKGAAYASPVTKLMLSNAPKQGIKYNIEWRQTGGFRKKKVREGAYLVVSTESNRMPEMSLCCRRDGIMIFNYKPGMPGIVELMHITSKAVKPGSEYSYELDEDSMDDIPAEAYVQLFLAPSEESRYTQPLASDITNCRMPAP